MQEAERFLSTDSPLTICAKMKKKEFKGVILNYSWKNMLINLRIIKERKTREKLQTEIIIKIFLISNIK